MKTYQKCLVAGTIAGIRSMAALAIVGRQLSRSGASRVAASPLAFLTSPATARVLLALTVGEMGGDKLPKAPNRTDPAPLGARAVTGGVSAAMLSVAEGARPAVGAALGVVAAVASTFAFYHGRRFAGEKLRIPDSLLGMSEDAVVGALSLALKA